MAPTSAFLGSSWCHRSPWPNASLEVPEEPPITSTPNSHIAGGSPFNSPLVSLFILPKVRDCHVLGAHRASEVYCALTTAVQGLSYLF